MKTLFTILFLFSVAYGQTFYNLTPEQFGARASDNIDDAPAFQNMADSAVKVNAKITLGYGRYILNESIYFERPLSNGLFNNFSISIKGQGNFWDIELTIITYNKKSGAAFYFQNTKGSEIEGIHFNGKYTVPKANIFTTKWEDYNDSTIIDTRYDPYAAIVIDKRNTGVRSGSTGVVIRKCSFRDWVGAINFSPSGYNQNDEMNTVEYCRGRNLKYFLSGGQTQEKTNVVRHIGLWDNIFCGFVFTKYGTAQPGQYYIEHVNMAGKCGSLTDRVSQSYFSLIFNNIYTETLGSIGNWNTNPKANNDAILNSFINLAYPHEAGMQPAINGNGVLIGNTVIRYYGMEVPLIFKGNVLLRDTRLYRNPILGTRYLTNDPDYNKGFKLNNIRAVDYIEGTTYTITGSFNINDVVVFMTNTDRAYLGNGLVTSVTPTTATLSFIPKTIKTGKYIIGTYEQTISTIPTPNN